MYEKMAMLAPNTPYRATAVHQRLVATGDAPEDFALFIALVYDTKAYKVTWGENMDDITITKK